MPPLTLYPSATCIASATPERNSHPSLNDDKTTSLTGSILTNKSYSLFNDSASATMGYFNHDTDYPTTLQGSVTISVGELKSVPDAGATVSLLAAGILGLAALRRRYAK